ncbi:Dual specificity protein phosphatase 10 [Clonorchis sinensis]|uniref:Dual specificity protein phosphatase 10 n=2 Tax=Clonorchis sinensis TaxID=79923 RepID=A0A8T1MTM5_CLOSI|nr:Dual specificity protein phosphatase 10 [Clonorchis sinensis]GAA50584.1 dual specificity protein phosphatase 10 [Clonorchis sinensis]
MSYNGARVRHHSCEKHSSKPQGCFQVCVEDVLKRLSRAKETGLDARLILVDTREGRLYQTGHILTALSMSCYTKTMARRALVIWDSLYSAQQACPAPRTSSQRAFCTQIYQAAVSETPVIVVYDELGECPFCSDSTAVGYFIDGLLRRGNYVYFMLGGFKAFQRLRSSEFIEAGTPVNSLPEFADSTSDGVTLSPGSQASHTFLSPLSCKPFTNLDLEKSPPSSAVVSPLQVRSDVAPVFPAPSLFKCMTQRSQFIQMHEMLPRPCVRNTLGLQKLCRSVATQSADADDILGAPVSEILPYLYIGNARDAQNNDLLSHLGITHIINVSVTVLPPFTDNQLYQYLILPVVDTDEQNLRPSIDRAVDFIYEAEKSNGVVLVHCVAGVSRSVAIVMAYLMHKYRNFTVLRALDFIQSRRPIAGPNLHFMGQLEHYYAELHSQPCQNPTNSPHRHSRRSSYVDFGEEFNSADFTVS